MIQKPKMTFDQFMIIVDEYYCQYPEMRFGQALMNCLWTIDPQMYNFIKETKIDCFYDTTIAEKTIAFLKKNWQMS